MGVDGPHKTAGHLQNTPKTRLLLGASGSQSALYTTGHSEIAASEEARVAEGEESGGQEGTERGGPTRHVMSGCRWSLPAAWDVIEGSQAVSEEF